MSLSRAAMLRGKSYSENRMWCLYIIQKQGKYYTGITTDLKNRMRQHGKPPLLYKEVFQDKFHAAQREKQIKSWSRAKKEKLIAKFSRPVS